MSPVLTTTPPATQAAIVRSVLAEKYPKQALGSIASHFGLTMVDLQAVLRHHGYPDPSMMSRAVNDLEAAPAPTPVNQATDVEPEADADETLVRTPVAKLLADPDNPRDNLLDIDELASSILEVGLLQPIVARRDGRRLIVVAGHRRLAAVKRLKWVDVPVIVRAEMHPDHVLAAMLIENGQRVDLDPIEEARGFASLKRQMAGSDEDVARRVGRSGAFVSNRIALLDLTAAEQAEVRAGSLGITAATMRGRMNAGKVMTTPQERAWHFSQFHDLSTNVKARCIRMQHKNGRKVGSIGCGECWEAVIRTDERQVLMNAHANDGTCPTCGSSS